MNETERLILESLYHLLNEDDSFTFEKKAICQSTASVEEKKNVG